MNTLRILNLHCSCPGGHHFLGKEVFGMPARPFIQAMGLVPPSGQMGLGTSLQSLMVSILHQEDPQGELNVINKH